MKFLFIWERWEIRGGTLQTMAPCGKPYKEIHILATLALFCHISSQLKYSRPYVYVGHPRQILAHFHLFYPCSFLPTHKRTVMLVSMSAAHPLIPEIMGEWVSIMDSLFLNPLWKNPHLAVSGEDSQQNLDQVKISLHKKIINLILEQYLKESRRKQINNSSRQRTSTNELLLYIHYFLSQYFFDLEEIILENFNISENNIMYCLIGQGTTVYSFLVCPFQARMPHLGPLFQDPWPLPPPSGLSLHNVHCIYYATFA